MKCPHCGTAMRLWTDSCEISTEHEREGDPIASVEIRFCPECNEPIIDLEIGVITGFYQGGGPEWKARSKERIFPVYASIQKLEGTIPQKYADQYYESYRVLPISPKASATLSRYLLQMVLHEELGITKRNLEEEIKELEKKEIVSAALVKMLQVFRKIANFGAHPKKSTNSNEIVEIEKGEAEIMLDLLQELFDCIFVKPKQQEAFLERIKEKYGIEV